MSAQVEDRHREAAMTALNSATREQHGEWHPEVAAVAQLLADTEAAAREQGAAVYSDSVDAERAGWVARVAELERERDEAKRVALVADLAGLSSLAAAICDKSRLAAERDAARSEVERLRAESAWVLCSKRPPDAKGDYLCSCEWMGESWVAACCWKSPGWVVPRIGRIVAWRQLPAPYQEEAPDA